MELLVAIVEDEEEFEILEKDVDIEDIKKFKEDLENVELDSNVAEGGG